MRPTDETPHTPALPAEREPAPEQQWLEYAEFGERFVAHAATEERVAAAVAGITGRKITFGPFSLGPAGLAGFVAEGKVGEPRIVRRGPHVHYTVTVPVSLALKALLAGRKLRLEAVVSVEVGLHARTASPLLVVIDIPAISPDDVSVVLRTQAGTAVNETLLDPIAGVVKREVANRVNPMLADPQTRRRRVFDIEAIVGGTESVHRRRAEAEWAFDWIDYAEFGRRFFPLLVTPERVNAVLAERLAGRPIEIGPLRTGPGRRATVTVRGAVRLPTLRPREPAPGHIEPVVYDVTLPVALDITVDVLKANRYRAELEVPLVLAARAADPLLLVIDVDPPEPAEIRLELAAEGVRAATLGALAKIRKQVVAQVAAVIRRELTSGSGRVIDVGARIGKAV
ncbi:hypothetical protein [Nocardia sp. NPDC057353]|uniref:hypothetical protein n=1 Tax=Nocardia sp. NPDC057353 TaxID=3346104 RepID=UPI0036306614